MLAIDNIVVRIAGREILSGATANLPAGRRIGLVGRNVTVHMPGGKIGIEIGDGYSIRMTGTVNKVAEGTMYPELFLVKV